MNVGLGIALLPPSASALAFEKRLCTKKPSKMRVIGWNALMYVTMKNADCDSPSAITRFTSNRRLPSRFVPLGRRRACAACE